MAVGACPSQPLLPAKVTPGLVCTGPNDRPPGLCQRGRGAGGLSCSDTHPNLAATWGPCPYSLPLSIPHQQYQRATYLDNVGDALVTETLHKGLQRVAEPWHQ